MRGWPQIKSGRYDIPAGASPAEILRQLGEGRVVLETLTVVEGWTFADMRRVVEAHPQLKVTLRGREIAELMAAIGHPGEHPEGRFFPDTYRFAAGTTDRDLYALAYRKMAEALASAWSKRAADLPLADSYQALTLASIVEKETGLASERPRIAGVFVTRLKRNMRLQTDPTVIYGIGAFLRRQHPRTRPAPRHAVQHVHTRGTAAHAHCVAVARGHRGGGASARNRRHFLRGHRRGRWLACVLVDARGAQCRRRPLSRAPEEQPNTMTQARFITLEGIEGAGKTTVADRITQSLRARGLTVHATREPGGTKLAERIRGVVLDRGEEHISATAEMLLMFGARQVHIDNLIRPALSRGEWVLCDRFTDATHAYQGGGRGVDRTLIDRIAQAVHGDLMPDCTLLLDVPVRVGLERMQARRGAVDRFEVESAQFFDRVRTRYLELAHAAPGRFRIIDATQSWTRWPPRGRRAGEGRGLDPAAVR